MSQIASAFPTAGGLYHWGSILGGKKWGWMTAWLNLIGLIFVIAAINFGTYDPFFRTLIAPMFGVDPASLTWWHQTAFIVAITVSQAVLNERGIKVASKITDLAGYLIFVVTIVLIGAKPRSPFIGSRPTPASAGTRRPGSLGTPRTGSFCSSARAKLSDTSRKTWDSGVLRAPQMAASSSEEASFCPRSTSDR